MVKSYLDNNRIQYIEKGNQLNIHKCPFCKNVNYKGHIHDKRFYINKNNGLFDCKNCGTKGNLISFIAQYENISKGEAYRKTYKKTYEDILDPKILEKKIDTKKDEIKYIQIPKEFVKLNHTHTKAINYMKSRGFFDLDVIEKLDIRYIEKGRIPFGVKEDGTERTIPVKERIVFPIYIENRAIGWQARDVTGLSDLRYLISSNLPKAKMIYNYENINNSSYITIVEGIIDLIKCFDINPICLLGKTLSNTQLSLLLKLPNLKRIYIAIDRDEEKAINEMGMLLSNFFEVFIIKTKEKDPGECTRMQMVEYKDSAIKFNQDNLNFTLS